MTSVDLLEFGEWHSFERPSVLKVPTSTGVYAIRLLRGDVFGRLQGTSDIVYIGSTSSTGTLRQRIQSHLGSRSLMRLFAAKMNMEIAWKTCDDSRVARKLEHTLIYQYMFDHLEPPPWNHQLSRKDLGEIITGAMKRRGS